ncbi:hypothetical protein NLU13_6454 [Sarocladium strictum]|uniref:Mitogen-activated protein kinase-binding protein 1 n=1 Tax=Sarocladium strictum TaxID=5046 RepID=A0AA39GHH5_SARSR|nr:hypothetical protein NLU13_6454 [Sarocladium strictum]
MAATPSNNRLKLTPSNSPFLSRPSRSPFRGRAGTESRLSLKRVIGTTCSSPTGFDTAKSSFAYIAGAAVVVVDVEADQYSQRFYRARPAAVPTYSASTGHHAPSTPTGTPKANDARRMALSYRDSPYSPVDGDPPGSRTWTSRERIKAATCLALSRDAKYVAVGETGYAPRVLIFSLQDASSDTPLVSISEHAFGVRAVAWSPDGRFLASLGEANDGFLYVWKVDPRTGAAKLFQQNRCTSYVRGMVWMGNCLITLGVRHVKMWKVEETSPTSPTKSRTFNESVSGQSSSTPQKTLPGRNIILGPLLEATFSAAAVDGKKLIICTEAGDVCTLDDDDRQLRLVKVLNVGFHVTTITIRGNIAYAGGQDGMFATLDVQGVMDGDESSVIETTRSAVGLLALGFMTEKLVTIDANHSIDIWSTDYVPGQTAQALGHIPIPGQGEPVAGVQAVERPNRMDAAFATWSSSGNISFWDIEGQVKLSVDVPVDVIEPETEHDLLNQLTYASVTKHGKLLVTADRQGVLKVTDTYSREVLLDTRAHSSDCQSISIYEDGSKFLMASCGRDRTTQLFHRTSEGKIEHFQTIEYAAKVVQVLIPSADRVITCSMDRTMQVHELVCRDDEPDAMAAIPLKVISLKASPVSMALGVEGNTIFVSCLDRSLCQYELSTGRQIQCSKCFDEGGSETAVLDSLSVGRWHPKDMDFLLGNSNTDKSIRLYECASGTFLDREWGHTESINGVTMVEDDDGTRKVVSVGSDGTIMIWTLDLNDPSPRSMSRDPSPAKEPTTGRPTLRRVLSKAELAEFQRPSSTVSSAGRRSPPRTLQRRTSRLNLTANTFKTPTGPLLTSPGHSTINEDTPSRRPSESSRASSPPPSPKSRITRRPSLPALNITAKKRASSNNLRQFGTLNTSTEQTCRTLRAYRKKLSSAEPLSPEVLAELDQELRLTAAALGDRAIRSKAMNETVLSGLLDQYSERLVTLLDEKLRLTYQPREREPDSPEGDRPQSPGADSGSSSSTV